MSRSSAEMASPDKGKSIAMESTDRSPRHFCWMQRYEDTLLDLLLREARKGNRPDGSFTASAYRNVCKDFNMIHGTSIMKKHIQSRIKTMKQHFVLFHGAFSGLSDFAWNHETKMFEAVDALWYERTKDNPRLDKLRDKACPNWDKLLELYGDTRATGAGAQGVREKSRAIQRGLQFEELHIETDEMPSAEASSFGEHEFGKNNEAPAASPEFVGTPTSAASTQSKLKHKATLLSVMENGYKSMAASIDHLSMALCSTDAKVVGNKVDVKLNCQIYEALQALSLDEAYRVRCYFYLCANPSKAAILVAAPNEIRAKLLDDIMKLSGCDG